MPFEPIVGLVFIAPGVAAIFAVIGAFFGFLASLFGYLIYTVTGGKFGSKNVNMGGNAFKAMLAPKMIAVSCTLSLVGTYIGMGWYYETWNVHAQLVKMTGEMFHVQDAGPTLAIFAAGIGLFVGNFVGGRLFPSAKAAACAVGSTGTPAAAPGAAACPVHAKGYFVGRMVFTLAGLVLMTYASIAAYYGNWSPGGVVASVKDWWTPLNDAQINIPDTGTAESGGAPSAWPTYRGGNARTGCLDGKNGPAVGKILWTYGNGGAEQFLAAPAVIGDYVFAGGTNAGVGGMYYSFWAANKGGNRSQLVGEPDRAAFPVFSPPAMVGNKLVVGEGLHEHQKTALRCLDLTAKAADRVVWELEVPSHLESGPAVVGDRVFTGAGDEGVLCVSLKEIAKPGSFDKELEIRTAAEPKVFWRQAFGDKDKKIKLHTDTSPAVVGDALVIGSGRFADVHNGEKVVVGDCSVVCLNAADGTVRWRYEISPPDAAQPLNPWGSPTVIGDLVLVGCSTCRFEPKDLKGSKGQVLALDIKTGSLKWKREAGGGVLSSAAAVAGKTAKDGKVVFCSADGSLDALNLDGTPAWHADLGAGVMAAPTVAGEYVYAVDVNAVVHARKLSDGSSLWTLNLNKELGAAKVGIVYGAPAAAGGRLYLGTDSGYFICIGEK